MATQPVLSSMQLLRESGRYKTSQRIPEFEFRPDQATRALMGSTVPGWEPWRIVVMDRFPMPYHSRTQTLFCWGQLYSRKPNSPDTWILLSSMGQARYVELVVEPVDEDRYPESNFGLLQAISKRWAYNLCQSLDGFSEEERIPSMDFSLEGLTLAELRTFLHRFRRPASAEDDVLEPANFFPGGGWCLDSSYWVWGSRRPQMQFDVTAWFKDVDKYTFELILTRLERLNMPVATAVHERLDESTFEGLFDFADEHYDQQSFRRMVRCVKCWGLEIAEGDPCHVPTPQGTSDEDDVVWYDHEGVYLPDWNPDVGGDGPPRHWPPVPSSARLVRLQIRRKRIERRQHRSALRSVASLANQRSSPRPSVVKLQVKRGQLQGPVRSGLRSSQVSGRMRSG